MAAASVALLVTSSAEAQEITDRLSVHGYLTQAYARSDRLQIDGINKEGTWDYRVVALQTRYALTENDQFVVQIRNRRLGLSPLSDEEDVTLDWGYYRHSFGDGNTSVKVGRVPYPLGLYNEIRNVGTVLPFFRAPRVFYLPGIETVDGFSLTNTIPLGAWRLESTLYGGGETTVSQVTTPSATIIISNRSDGIYGAQEWISTPIQGLRLGAAYHRFESPTGDGQDTVPNNLFAGSIDGTFEHAFLRGEYMKYIVDRALPGLADYDQINYYGQGGVQIFEPLWLNAQVQIGKTNYGGFRFRDTFDRAIGVSYKISPGLVLKLEGHAARGYSFDSFVQVGGPPGKTNYGIASLSASF